MSNPSAPSPLPARPADAWAEVRAHDQVMRYRRSGAGRAVLVLGAPHGGNGANGIHGANGAGQLWPELPDALAARFRLIVPELPTAGADAAWLADFLEGLGTPGVAVVAAEPFCTPALELACRDADQIARVVLVPLTEAGGEWVLGTSARAAGVALLVVARELAAGEALPLVARFLAGDGAAGTS